MNNQSSSTRAFAFRLKPKNDLKKSIVAFARENKVSAGSIVTAVGSPAQRHVRFSNRHSGELRKGFFEIVSLSGTCSSNSCHLHISLSDHTGKTTGGHLLDDNFIYGTAAVIVIDLPDLEFQRAPGANYGFNELIIDKRNPNP